MGLNDHEIEVLRVAAGEQVPGFSWGAWVAVCLEHLRSAGLVTRGTHAVATDKGRAELARLRA